MGKAVEHNQTDLPTATFLGETVAKAIRRLAGGDVGKKRQQAQRKLQQKIKKKLYPKSNLANFNNQAINNQ